MAPSLSCRPCRATSSTDYINTFRPEHYTGVAAKVLELAGLAPTFRLCESPVFLSDDLAQRLLESANSVSDVLADPTALEATAAAIADPYWSVPASMTTHSSSFTTTPSVGRAIISCRGSSSCRASRRCTASKPNLRRPFGKTRISRATRIPTSTASTRTSYFELLRQAVLGDHDAAKVILLEIDPWRQNTAVDFASTRRHLGIPVVGLDELRREGRQLFYETDGERRPVKRIYNRVILDELLLHPDRKFDYNFKEEVDVEWAGHPDWFLRISKHTLPALAHLGNVPGDHLRERLHPRNLRAR